MFWQGEKMDVHTPKDAALLGIATVYQDLALCDNLDIVANMYLGLNRRSIVFSTKSRWKNTRKRRCETFR